MGGFHFVLGLCSSPQLFWSSPHVIRAAWRDPVTHSLPRGCSKPSREPPLPTAETPKARDRRAYLLPPRPPRRLSSSLPPRGPYTVSHELPPTDKAASGPEASRKCLPSLPVSLVAGRHVTNSFIVLMSLLRSHFLNTSLAFLALSSPVSIKGFRKFPNLYHICSILPRSRLLVCFSFNRWIVVILVSVMSLNSLSWCTLWNFEHLSMYLSRERWLPPSTSAVQKALLVRLSLV